MSEMVRLRDLGKWSGGNTPSKEREEYWTNGSVPWVSPKDMKAEEITSSQDRISEVAMNEGRASLLPSGSILVVTRSGILSHTLPVATTRIPVTINQDLKALVPRKDVLPNYVAYALRGASQRILKSCSKHGTTVASIETNAFLDFEIPMVELDEQRRIVAEIEKQFSRLDEAVANLLRVKANLKRYKAAVLKAAVEGHLVETEASLAHREARSYEAGEQLLQRILTERRGSWKGRGKYVDPAVAAGMVNFPLPAGWSCSTLESITDPNRVICYGILMPKENLDEGVLFVKVRDMRGDSIDLNALHKTSHEIAAKYARASLKTGDVLLSIRGTYGRVAVVPPLLDGGNITQDTARVAVSRDYNSAFVAAFLRSEDAQRYFKQVARGVAVKGVNIGDVRPMPIPIPPLAEQSRIVAEVDRHLSIIREVEAEVDANLQRAQALRQAVLTRAFAVE